MKYRSRAQGHGAEQVKGTGSWCMLEACVKDNYYEGFIPPAITAAEKCTLLLDSTSIFYSTQNSDKVRRKKISGAWNEGQCQWVKVRA